jgi:crotonobetaine/carnitine-CoA ligase
MAWYPIDKVETPAELRRRVEAMTLPRNFIHMLEEGAHKFGGKEAWRFFEEEGRWASLSYDGLRDAVFRTANALAGRGIGKGAHVIVMSNNRPEFPLVWMALGCLGAVMVPANIKYTAREIDYLVDDAEVAFAVVEPSFLDAFRSAEKARALVDPARMILMGAGQDGLPGLDGLYDAATAAAPADRDLPPDTIVNIQYTSGTTGFPKGCLLSHDYWLLIALLCHEQNGAPLTNILLAQHFYYMDPQWLMLMAFLQGGTAFIATKPSVKRFMDWVREFHIHYCILFEPIFKAPPDPRDGENDLRVVNIFGFTPANHGPFEKRFNTRAREAFGMTEIGSALYVPLDREDRVGSASCGIAVPFRQAKVMVGREREAAPEEVGELWVTGRSMMQGYWKRPQVNAEQFVDGWFRTGDLFKRDAEGYFYYQGRSKDMIRRNAENVAAREVETVLREMDQIEEAAVVAVPDDLKGEEIKAYILLRPGIEAGSVPPEQILAHCAKRLARFKIPRFIAFVDKFPMTVSDRVEKKVLIAGVPDLRAGSYDAEEARWR